MMSWIGIMCSGVTSHAMPVCFVLFIVWCWHCSSLNSRDNVRMHARPLMREPHSGMASCFKLAKSSYFCLHFYHTSFGISISVKLSFSLVSVQFQFQFNFSSVQFSSVSISVQISFSSVSLQFQFSSILVQFQFSFSFSSVSVSV